MKISARILSEQLSERFPVNCYGRGIDNMTFHAIRFYDKKEPLHDSTAYLMSRKDFAACSGEPAGCTGSNVQYLIILTDGLPDKLPDDGCCILASPMKFKPAELFNAVQEIIDRFDQWDEELSECLRDNADIQKMLSCSIPVLNNLIILTNAHMEIMCSAECDEMSGVPADGSFRQLPVEYIREAQKQYNNYIERHEPFIHSLDGGGQICTMNLFADGRNCGNLSLMSNRPRAFRHSDYQIFCHLGKYVQDAILYRNSISSRDSKFKPIKKALQGILDGSDIDDELLYRALKNLLALPAGPQAWVCMAAVPSSTINLIVPEYIIRKIIECLPDCIAFQYKDNIVILASASGECGFEDAVPDIEHMLEEGGYCLGISDCFDALHDMKAAYDKANAAIDVGMQIHVDHITYRFTDYRLPYMLMNAKGSFRLADLYSPGMRALIAHDEQSTVSYVETLRAYLDNRMNTTRTAKALFLHRSSVELRLQNIFALLGTDLSESDSRLYYEIILKMMIRPE
jgi:Sugar diacid utilization regulator